MVYVDVEPIFMGGKIKFKKKKKSEDVIIMICWMRPWGKPAPK